METGDADEEYAREEELALMGAQIPSYSRFYESGSSLRAENQSATLPGQGRNMPNSQMAILETCQTMYCIKTEKPFDTTDLITYSIYCNVQ